MSIRFNADEVLEMAEKIEANAVIFYRKAAGLKQSKRDSEFLLSLAEMEVGHQRIFATMRKELSDKEKESTAYDPMGEGSLYLAALADSRGGEGMPSITDQLKGTETIAEVLRTAVELEKKAVLFYLGVRDMVPESLGKDRIDRIIGEEKSHVVVLTQYLTRATQK